MGAEELESNEPRGRTKIERLNCWPEVKLMLENSVPIRDIVHHIQVVKEEYTEVSSQSLNMMIRQWITRHHDRLMDRRIPVQYLNLMDSLVEHVDPLDAANMLFAVQMDRVMMTYAKEKKHQQPLIANTHDIRLSDQIVRTMSILKSDSFKHRMALMNKDKSGDNKDTMASIERVRKHYEEKFGKTAAIVALSDESRAKVYNALNRIQKGDSEPVLRLLRENTAKAEALMKAEDERSKS